MAQYRECGLVRRIVAHVHGQGPSRHLAEQRPHCDALSSELLRHYLPDFVAWEDTQMRLEDLRHLAHNVAGPPNGARRGPPYVDGEDGPFLFDPNTPQTCELELNLLLRPA